MTRHAAKITPRNKVRIGPRRVDAGKESQILPHENSVIVPLVRGERRSASRMSKALASTSYPWPLVNRKVALWRVGAMPQPSLSLQRLASRNPCRNLAQRLTCTWRNIFSRIISNHASKRGGRQPPRHPRRFARGCERHQGRRASRAERLCHQSRPCQASRNLRR